MGIRVRLFELPPPMPSGLVTRVLERLPTPLLPGECQTLELSRSELEDGSPPRVEATLLLERVPAAPPGWLHLGLCGVDLFVPALTYVFGVSHLGERRALLSWHRLQAGNGGTKVLEERLLIEAVHELGHAGGLVHCAVADCAMHRAMWPESVDLKKPDYCPTCQASLRTMLEALEVPLNRSGSSRGP